MSLEPTFRVGELAYVKPGTYCNSGISHDNAEVVIIAPRGTYLGPWVCIDDGYAVTLEGGHALVDHKSLYRKRPPCEDKSQFSFSSLIQTLKESSPCESNTPLTTSEPLEVESLQRSSISPQTSALDVSLSMILSELRRLLVVCKGMQSSLKPVSSSTKEE